MKKQNLDDAIKGYFKSKRRPSFDAMVMKNDGLEVNSLMMCKESVSKSDDSMESFDESTGCPSEELFAAYIEGSADKREMALMKAHIKNCDTCQESLKLTREMLTKNEEGKLPAPPASVTGPAYKKITQKPPK